jgi:hypothetical protein
MISRIIHFILSVFAVLFGLYVGMMLHEVVVVTVLLLTIAAMCMGKAVEESCKAERLRRERA